MIVHTASIYEREREGERKAIGQMRIAMKAHKMPQCLNKLFLEDNF